MRRASFGLLPWAIRQPKGVMARNTVKKTIPSFIEMSFIRRARAASDPRTKGTTITSTTNRNINHADAADGAAVFVAGVAA